MLDIIGKIILSVYGIASLLSLAIATFMYYYIKKKIMQDDEVVQKVQELKELGLKISPLFYVIVICIYCLIPILHILFIIASIKAIIAGLSEENINKLIEVTKKALDDATKI